MRTEIADDESSGKKKRTFPPTRASKEPQWIEEEEQDLERAFTLPRPDGASGSKATFMGSNAEAGFSYWWHKLSFPKGPKAISMDFKAPAENEPMRYPRYFVYVYRTIPEWDAELIGQKEKYIAKYTSWPFIDESGNAYPEWRKGILETFGSGRYRFEIYDKLARRSICNWEAEAFDWRYMPRMSFDAILMESKANKSVIATMRSLGVLLPGDIGYERGGGLQTKKGNRKNEDDSTMNEMVTNVMGQLAQRALEPTPVPAESPIMAKMFEMLMQQKQNQGFDMASMMEAMSKMIEATNLGRAVDNSDSKDFTERMKTLQEATMRQMDSMKEEYIRRENRLQEVIERRDEEIRELRNRLQDLQLELIKSKNERMDMFSQIETVTKLKQSMGSILGPRHAAPEKEESSFAWIKELLPMMMPFIGPSIAQMMQSQMGGLAITNPQAQAAMMQQAQQAHAQPQAPQPQPASPNPPSGGQTGSIISREGYLAYGDQARMFVQMFAPLLGQYRQMIIDALLSDKAGEDFADDFIEEYGKQIYNQIKGVKHEDLAAAVISFAPIWDAVKAKVTVESVKTFAEHFINAENYWSDEDNEGEKEPSESKPN